MIPDRPVPTKPLGLRTKLLHQHFDHKLCLHPHADKNVCDKIVSAHSIQRSRELAQIIDSENKVATFYPPGPDAVTSGKLELRHVGWRQASTFSGLCGIHDGETFRQLETTPFTNTKEQCFLVAYRAACHELYQKIASLRSQKDPEVSASNFFDLPLEMIPAMVHATEVQEAGTEAGVTRITDLKRKLDDSLISRNYDGWVTLTIPFEGPLTLVSTGVIHPNRSLVDDRELQVLHDPDADIQALMLGIVATGSGGAIILMWEKGANIIEEFIGEFDDFPRKDRLNVFVQFIFKHIENTFFSEEWWNSLPHNSRQHLHDLAYLGINPLENAYYKRTKYIKNVSRIPWTIGETTLH